MEDSRYETGMRVRRAVLGDAHVDRAEARKTAFDEPFQRFITETAWSGVWTRPDLDRRTRSLVTIAILAALGRHEELALHLRASANTGAAAEEIREVLLHVAVYAGVPAANTAMAIAKDILDQAGAGARSEEPPEEGRP
ncbi:MAG: 4-carboxymuconolactone decarboxylase [Chloroflexota bacterium]